MSNITLQVNGRPAVLREADPAMPLLYALRGELGLIGPKFGCGMAQCGACTVLVDGQPVRSCVTPVGSLAGKPVQTLEGLAAGGRLHPVQQAFIDEQAMQCGYCANGMIMAAKALLERVPRPSEAQVREALHGHLCRCGSHNRIVKAVQRAGVVLAGA